MIKEGYSPKSEKGRRDLFNKQDMRNLLVISANKQNGNDKGIGLTKDFMILLIFQISTNRNSKGINNAKSNVW